MAGADLSENYPIDVDPTREHAEMPLNRIEFFQRRSKPGRRRYTPLLTSVQPGPV